MCTYLYFFFTYDLSICVCERSQVWGPTDSCSYYGPVADANHTVGWISSSKLSGPTPTYQWIEVGHRTPYFVFVPDGIR